MAIPDLSPGGPGSSGTEGAEGVRRKHQVPAPEPNTAAVRRYGRPFSPHVRIVCETHYYEQVVGAERSVVVL
jgi:hypothetical protein